jgi:tellurite resistance protein TerC
MIRHAKRLLIFVVGMSVLLFGIALLVLPGPAFVVIPVGLAILATEYAWARRCLRVMRETAEKGAERLNLTAYFPFLSRFRVFSRKKDANQQSASSGR